MFLRRNLYIARNGWRKMKYKVGGKIMKLIDILVMISKGELKEGTTFRDKETGMKISEFVLGKKELDENRLNEEYELIEPKEPDHFTDVGKMAEKIEELEDSDVLNLPYRTIKFSMDERTIQMYFSEVVRRLKMHEDKLNEVIRRINNE